MTVNFALSVPEATTRNFGFGAVTALRSPNVEVWNAKKIGFRAKRDGQIELKTRNGIGVPSRLRILRTVSCVN